MLHAVPIAPGNDDFVPIIRVSLGAFNVVADEPSIVVRCAETNTILGLSMIGVVAFLKLKRGNCLSWGRNRTFDLKEPKNRLARDATEIESSTSRTRKIQWILAGFEPSTSRTRKIQWILAGFEPSTSR